MLSRIGQQRQHIGEAAPLLRPEGRSSWYSLAQPVLLIELVAAAEALLAATGTNARLCRHLTHAAPLPTGRQGR